MRRSLIALLVLAAIQDAVWGMLYLALFGIGTIAGMMLITVAIAATFGFSSSRFPRSSIYLRGIAGLVSVGFGVFLIYYVGFVP